LSALSSLIVGGVPESVEIVFLVGFWVVIAWTALKDWRRLRIPFLASPLLIVMGALRLFVLQTDYSSFVAIAVGAVLTGGSLFLVGAAFQKYRGVTGLGSGDPLYAGTLALWVDPLNIPWAIIIACVVTLAVGGLRLWVSSSGRAVQKQIPFAPGLGIGFGVVGLVEATWR
jgi:prepilin signal peptidase PulO-like enzyme (type II secretory pathway)